MLRDGSSDAQALRGFEPTARIDTGKNMSGDDMAGLIEDEIIPRLVLAHRAQPLSAANTAHARSDGPGNEKLGAEHIADLAQAGEPGILLDMAESCLAAGLSVESLLVDVLAPAARCLGRRWEDDSADFIDVTMGLWRMQEVVHLLGLRRGADEGGSAGRRILFAVIPDDTHSFGSVMLEEIFERAGWAGRNCRSGSLPELLAEVRGHWFDFIALSVSIDQQPEALTGLITRLRAAARNPDLTILVGGRVFTEQPGLAEIVGADGTAADALSALRMAEEILAETQRALPGQADHIYAGTGQMHAGRGTAGPSGRYRSSANG